MKAITMMFALGLALLCTSTAVLAKKQTTTTTQAHHCQLHGTEVPKSKKACVKAGGVWEKGAPAAKPATGTATEPAK